MGYYENACSRIPPEIVEEIEWHLAHPRRRFRTVFSRMRYQSKASRDIENIGKLWTSSINSMLGL